jgi:hypothetical protein
MANGFSRDDAARTIEAIIQAESEGYPRKSTKPFEKSSLTRAAEILGVNFSTMRSRCKPNGALANLGFTLPDEIVKPKAPDYATYFEEAKTRAIEPKPIPLADPIDDFVDPKINPIASPIILLKDTSLTPAERRDAEFWRKRYESERKGKLDVEHLLNEVSGVVGQRVVPPQWLMPSIGGPKKRSVIGLLLTDLHVGEVVDPDEISGLNAYNPEIFQQRIRRYIMAACEVGVRWSSDCQNQGAFVVIGGDLISGDIHDELRMTNALTAHEQALLAAQELTAGLKHVADTYGRVHVVCVAGNHGRTTVKPSQKQYARLSYDTLTTKMVAMSLAGDKRITIDIPNSRDAIVPIFGRNVFINHGDGMGTGGGMGFAGPILPIARGSKKVELQQFRAKRSFDLLLHGHYHHSANQNMTLSNGSFPAYTEYGNGLRMGVEPPQQWLFLLHERWWLRERAEIQLDEPSFKPLPPSQSPFAR